MRDGAVGLVVRPMFRGGLARHYWVGLLWASPAGIGTDCRYQDAGEGCRNWHSRRARLEGL